MILYFADRVMNIKGQASTALLKGFQIVSDRKVEEVETGVASFECSISFDDKNRLLLEEMTDAGNYLLRSCDGVNEFYTIIDTEIDTKRKEVYIYAEDAGLDLLNEIAGEFEADKSYTIDYYINKWINDSGFEIGINEVPTSTTRKLSWTGETSCTERLASIATQFGGYEISYSFEVKGMEITRKYVNIHKTRGQDIGIQLRLNRDIDRIITKKSVANLATAFVCTGGTPEDAEKPITLKGYTYDDGDFYVGSDGVLRSRKAVEKWSRYVWNKEPNRQENAGGHIWKTYSYDTTSQATLCSHAITELKKICDMEINFEIELKRLPDGVKIGDRVDIVDDAGQLYLSTRILKLESSEVDREQKATLGEHLIKDSGISQRVEELAAQFSEIAKSRVFYTWVAYADDENGTGISLSPRNKDYLGIASNRLTKTVDISDPSIFEWSKIKGDKGDPGTPGANGTSVIAVLDQYYLSTSPDAPEGGYWSATLPAWSSGHYIWERKAVTWSDGSTTYTDPILNSALNHANEAAEFAKQQANTAAQSATAAERAASNAGTAAQEAANKASQAESLAQNASGTATQAKNEAEAAQEAADKANKDIVQISNEITNVRKEVAEGLETLTDTMSVGYAKKTDLTDIQGSLQVQISKNAAGIKETYSSVESIKIDASEAVKNANAANTMALAAQSTADNAKTAADKAQEFADASSAAAQTAQTEATVAQTAANTAKTAAENAQAVADAANEDLEAAKAELEAVKSRPNATEEDIAAAQEAVNAAQKAADKAKADAIAAQSAAETARMKADTAKAVSEAAQVAAARAQTDADNARAAAVKAQADAQAILDELSTMGNKITEAETNIEKNAKAIALSASKTEVAEQLDGYYTKKEADAKFNVTAEYVSSTVKSEVESVKIGGRNLLRFTENMPIDYNVTSGIGTWSWQGLTKTEEGLRLDADETVDSNCFWIPLAYEGAVDNNEEITLSFDYRGDFTKFGNFYFVHKTNNTSCVITDWVLEPSETEWKHFEKTFSNEQANSEGCISVLLFYGHISTSGKGTWLEVKNKSLKLEKGNKATDWSPAPEDMATAEAMSDVKSKAESNSSAILQLANSLNFLVGSDSGGSYFQQDENGNWYFTSAETETEMKAIRDILNTLAGDTETSLEELKKQLEALNSLTNYVHISTEGESPSIELGKNDPNNPYRTVITHTAITYYNGSIVLAVFDKDGLTADKVTVNKELVAVGVRFRKKSNGYVGLGLF